MLMDISLSALTPSQYRKYVKGWDKKRYADLFAQYNSDRNAYRIYIPLQKGSGGRLKYANAPKAVVEALNAKGYNVEDYVNGIAVDSSGKRRMKMGKLLPPELQKIVANDPVRQGAKSAATGDQMIVISRHPYDVAGMSTDRGWSSCMNIVAGSNMHYVERDVRDGSIIAYLVHKTDLNVKNPSARILMRVYKSSSGKTGLFPSAIYGSGGPDFTNTIRRWCSEVNTKYFNIPFGETMNLLSSLYSDSGSPAVVTHYDHSPDSAVEQLRARMVEAPDQFAGLYHEFAKDYTTTEDQSAVFDMILHSGNQEWFRYASADAAVWMVETSRGISRSGPRALLREWRTLVSSAARIVLANAKAGGTIPRSRLFRATNAAEPTLVLLSDAWQSPAPLTADDIMLIADFYSLDKMLNGARMIMEQAPTRELADAYDKVGLSDEGAVRSFIRNPLWYKLDITGTKLEGSLKSYLKKLKKNEPEEFETDDEGVKPMLAATTAEAKLPALFKKHYSIAFTHPSDKYLYQDRYWQETNVVLLDRMPDDKWPTAVRGMYNPLLLMDSDAQYTTSPAGQAALGKVIANYATYMARQNTVDGIKQWLDGNFGNRLMTPTLLAQIPDKVAATAAASVYLSLMLGGSGGDRGRRIEQDTEVFIAGNPYLYVACCDFTYTNIETAYAYCQNLAKLPVAVRSKLGSGAIALATAPRAHHAIQTSCPFLSFAAWAADYVEDIHPTDWDRHWADPDVRNMLKYLAQMGARL